MKEIIHIQVGQCGNEISSKFWDLLCQEHGIDDNGVRTSKEQDKVEVYFRENASGRHIPRAILTDLEPRVIDSIKASSKGELFSPENFIVDNAGAGACNNWARGYCTEGAELLESLMNAIRKEAEACDYLQGFQLAHSLGGGTGSGFGTLILTELAEEYPDRIRQTFSVLPHFTEPDVVVAPYNCVLALNYLTKECDIVNVFDNEALFGTCSKHLNIGSPTIHDANRLISRAMSGITSNFRFQGQLNSDLGKLKMSLVPSPKLHFLTVSLAPLASPKIDPTIEEISHQLFDPRNILCSVDPSKGKYFRTTALYRSDSSVPTEVIEKQTRSALNQNSKYFSDCVCSNVATPLDQMKLSATLLGNTTALGEVFKRAHEKFSAMWKKKAFGKWYMGEGMCESKFTDAEANILDLISEYEKYQNLIKDDDWEKVL